MYSKNDEAPLIHDIHVSTLKLLFPFTHIFLDAFSRRKKDMKRGRNEALKQAPAGKNWFGRLYGTVDVSKYASSSDTTIKHYHKFSGSSNVLEVKRR